MMRTVLADGSVDVPFGGCDGKFRIAFRPCLVGIIWSASIAPSGGCTRQVDGGEVS